MRIGIVIDRGGCGFKERFIACLLRAGHEIIAPGAHKLSSGGPVRA